MIEDIAARGAERVAEVAAPAHPRGLAPAALEERRAIVAFLRRFPQRDDTMGYVETVADAIERGDHTAPTT
jgi:hypothetical protein